MDRSKLAKKRHFYQATLLGAAICLAGSQAFAQSAGSFLTSPYVPPPPPPSEPTIEADKTAAESKCVCPDPKAVVAPDKAKKTNTTVPSATQVKARKPAAVTGRAARPKSTKPAEPSQKKVESKDISPVVMFRPTPNLMPTQADGAVMTTVALEPIDSILPDPVAPVALAMEDPPKAKAGRVGLLQRLKNVVKPIIPKKKKVDPNAKPTAFARIWRDSKTGLLHDAPEALADALPWVDKSQKAEPIQQVLNQVVDDLNRAAAQDPEWVNPAERELRELSKRLSTLSAPPPLPPKAASSGDGMSPSFEEISTGRRFRPRPIWPGATVTAEVQSRPATVVTDTALDDGPPTEGQLLPLVADSGEGGRRATQPSTKKASAKRTSRRSR